ncbi:hypothetical protein ACNA6I_14970 [Rossellomorea sp. FS2]|uniref:hypothetical protein n=1 Tax=Rossellomorea sp. FS2 TaxID=3391447 RepID=UPI003A4D5FB4
MNTIYLMIFSLALVVIVSARFWYEARKARNYAAQVKSKEYHQIDPQLEELVPRDRRQ